MATQEQFSYSIEYSLGAGSHCLDRVDSGLGSFPKRIILMKNCDCAINNQKRLSSVGPAARNHDGFGVRCCSNSPFPMLQIA
ncbi:conserved hypothetical protein [Ricinus communis]|uniref:Uncharacterized protein n=1 Tax=Ricinus communis TaxID=3988 RepID=B9SXN7_RICCO|nr:conserved hypothetical protein [Ricinus communis]